MWRLLRRICSPRIVRAIERFRRPLQIFPIDSAGLASLSAQSADTLMVFDLRDSSEIEQHSYCIPGALLAANVDFDELVRWIPPKTIVVLYATANIPAHHSCLHLAAKGLKFYVLEGGLQSWREAGRPFDAVTFGMRRSAGRG
jgi:rhodanese-related sulfurtransferase